MNNTVIACVDGSPSTRPVGEYAAGAAGKLGAPLALLHVLEKSETPAVSDLTGSIGIDSREQLTEALVRVEGERSRLLMAQGKAVLAGCAELLKQTGQPDAQLLQKHGALDEILAAVVPDTMDAELRSELEGAGVPTIKMIPDDMEIVYVQTPRKAGPFGASGVGEMPVAKYGADGM